MKIIPKPELIEKTANGFFKFVSNTKLIQLDGGSSAASLIETVRAELFFLDFDEGEENKVEFIKEDKGFEYVLDIGKDIQIFASTDEGMFHAAMTLKQLIFEYYDNGVSPIPYAKISDSPKFGHRGFMLDVTRHFFKKEFVKSIIEIMARVKMNVLHLHLSDNQGFRVQCDTFPKLNEIGSLSFGSDGVIKKNFYTKEDVKEIVDYAKERFIEIIPEIDLPGHTIALLAAYPELSCTGENFKLSDGYEIDDKILCAGNDDTYKFVYALLDEMCAVFDCPRFHIGGDEVPKRRWNKCPKCLDKIKTENLKNTEELQGFFTNKVVKHLKEHGKTAIVWNDTLKCGHLDDSATVQYWISGPQIKRVRIAAKAGRKIIASKVFAYYLDYPYGTTSLRCTYNFDPTGFAKSGGKENVIGVEAPLWTEFIKTEERVMKLVFPRLYAVAESGWSSGEKNYRDFADRLDNVLGIMLAYGQDFTTVKKSNPCILSYPFITAKFFIGFKKKENNDAAD